MHILFLLGNANNALVAWLNFCENIFDLTNITFDNMLSYLTSMVLMTGLAHD